MRECCQESRDSELLGTERAPALCMERATLRHRGGQCSSRECQGGGGLGGEVRPHSLLPSAGLRNPTASPMAFSTATRPRLSPSPPPTKPSLPPGVPSWQGSTLFGQRWGWRVRGTSLTPPTPHTQPGTKSCLSVLSGSWFSHVHSCCSLNQPCSTLPVQYPFSVPQVLRAPHTFPLLLLSHN